MTGATHDEQAQLGPSYDGTVVLDIGGDIGALIIVTPPELHLAELELSRVDGGDPGPDSYDPHDHYHTHAGEHQHAGEHEHGGEHGHAHADGGSDHPHTARRTHVAVRERRGPTGVRYAAIYPALPAGEYTVYDTAGLPADTVMVVGGEVAELDWR